MLPRLRDVFVVKVPAQPVKSIAAEDRQSLPMGITQIESGIIAEQLPVFLDHFAQS